MLFGKHTVIRFCNGMIKVRILEKAVVHFGAVDCVFANAGFGVSGEVELLQIEDFDRQFETNVYGAVRTALAALHHLKKSRGSFAITGSVMSHLSLPGGAPYAMSKFAVRALADSLRGEWKRYGISVTLISPGFVASEIRLVDNEGKLKEHSKDPVPSWLVMPAADAARDIVSALQNRKSERVITGHGKFLVALNRYFPWFVNTVLVPRFATPPGRKGWSE